MYSLLADDRTTFTFFSTPGHVVDPKPTWIPAGVYTSRVRVTRLTHLRTTASAGHNTMTTHVHLVSLYHSCYFFVVPSVVLCGE